MLGKHLTWVREVEAGHPHAWPCPPSSPGARGSSEGHGGLSAGGQSCLSGVADTSPLWLLGPEIWLAQTEMALLCKIHTGF